MPDQPANPWLITPLLMWSHCVRNECDRWQHRLRRHAEYWPQAAAGIGVIGPAASPRITPVHAELSKLIEAADGTCERRTDTRPELVALGRLSVS